MAIHDEQSRALAELARNVGTPPGPRDEVTRAKIEELTTTNAQLVDALKCAGVPPIPPAHLQRRVVGVHHPQFLSSANLVLQQFDEALAGVGKRLGDFRSVLDFGVGCGRVIRRFWDLYPNSNLTGADIDQEAMAWLQNHYVKMGKFVVLPHLPPSSFTDEAFDLVYGISVFTHLNEDMQFSWLSDLRRITRPGGYLLLTVHGRNH